MQELERKKCTLTRIHISHSWYSRRLLCYFWCRGR